MDKTAIQVGGRAARPHIDRVRFHVVGIVGVPGNYGGFETLTDQLLDSALLHRCSIVVYCEERFAQAQNGKYKGAELRALRWRANGWQSIVHDTVGLWRASIDGGVILVLGTSATFWLPLLRALFKGNRYIVNMAGLEWSRSKWGRWAKLLLKYNEAVAAQHAHALIADNQGLVDYVLATYKRKAEMIAYGGDQFLDVEPNPRVFQEYTLPASYDFAMARAQIDNNMEMILQAYASHGTPLVFVSNWDSSDYGRSVRVRYKEVPNLYLIGPVYDIAKIKALHSHVRLYVHGHSAGGTNPVLVEAMWAGLPIAAFDVVFNRCTTHGLAHYFKSADALVALLNSTNDSGLLESGKSLADLARHEYSWSKIRSAYEALILDRS